MKSKLRTKKKLNYSSRRARAIVKSITSFSNDLNPEKKIDARALMLSYICLLCWETCKKPTLVTCVLPLLPIPSILFPPLNLISNKGCIRSSKSSIFDDHVKNGLRA